MSQRSTREPTPEKNLSTAYYVTKSLQAVKKNAIAQNVTSNSLSKVGHRGMREPIPEKNLSVAHNGLTLEKSLTSAHNVITVLHTMQ